jgi:two-component system response regulator GlrR
VAELRSEELDRTMTQGQAQTQETLEITIEEKTRAWAVEVQDEEEVRRLPVGARPLLVGSSRDADIVMRDRTVSGRHCEVVVARDGVAVRDLGSTNGTYVGGARVNEAWGTEGTTITIGQSTLVCVAQQDEDSDDAAKPLPGLAGASVSMRRIAANVRRLSKASAPVLVIGETGVGKELVARALHTEGPRVEGPFVVHNMASLPRELVESELFGHERGAFTGAVSRRVGAFVEAEGGTLFLDEIGELPLDAQPKLLRALDGYEVRRIGGAGSGRRLNARVVTATNVALGDAVEKGAFRRDLFHRLEVFVLEVPPLRARPGDITPIARALLAHLEGEIGHRELTPAAIAQLTSHPWPGNVRELKGVLQRAGHAARGRWLDAPVIERALRRVRRAPPLRLDADLARELLARHGGNVSAAARAGGVPRTTFRKLLGES